MYKVGFIGNIIQVPEYLLQDEDFKLESIIYESKRLSDELLTFSVVRGIPIIGIDDNNQLLQIINNQDVNFYVMCSFGRRISEDVIRTRDIYNIHLSNLPYYKGRHPTFWATLNNENKIGISIHKVEAKIDAGDIISQRLIPYYIWMSEIDIFNELITKIPELLNDLKKHIRGEIAPVKNTPGFYYPIVSEGDITINLEKDTFRTIFNKVRAQKRYKGARIMLSHNIIWAKNIIFTKSTPCVKNNCKWYHSLYCVRCPRPFGIIY